MFKFYVFVREEYSEKKNLIEAYPDADTAFLVKAALDKYFTYERDHTVIVTVEAMKVKEVI
jgi:hypothetical protein